MFLVVSEWWLQLESWCYGGQQGYGAQSPAMILGSHCGAMMNTVPEEGAVIIILEAVLKGWRTKRYDKSEHHATYI